jgi:hypothetical protein
VFGWIATWIVVVPVLASACGDCETASEPRSSASALEAKARVATPATAAATAARSGVFIDVPVLSELWLQVPEDSRFPVHQRFANPRQPVASGLPRTFQ